MLRVLPHTICTRCQWRTIFFTWGPKCMVHLCPSFPFFHVLPKACAISTITTPTITAWLFIFVSCPLPPLFFATLYPKQQFFKMISCPVDSRGSQGRERGTDYFAWGALGCVCVWWVDRSAGTPFQRHEDRTGVWGLPLTPKEKVREERERWKKDDMGKIL